MKVILWRKKRWEREKEKEREYDSVRWGKVKREHLERGNNENKIS